MKILNEIRILSSLEHSNIIRYYTSWVEFVQNEDPTITLLKSEDDDPLGSLPTPGGGKISAYLAMECADSTLDRFIELNYNSHDFDFNHASIIYQIANGIQYLHSLSPKCAHGDLTTSNVLLLKTKSSYQVKICDFGMSKYIGPCNSNADHDNNTVMPFFADFGESLLQLDILRFSKIIFQLITFFTT